MIADDTVEKWIKVENDYINYGSFFHVCTELSLITKKLKGQQNNAH